MALSVAMIACTPRATRVVAAAAKLCWSASSAAELFEGLDEAAARSFIAKLRSSGHMSPFEHASFTFAIDGLSRVASHQLVRHRLASFSQQSQRYVTMGEPRVVVPDAVARDERARRLFEDAARSAHSTYSELISLGVPKEDARAVLPHGWETSLVLTMNARELDHFFSLRLCRRAQLEIRRLARAMLALVRAESAELFSSSGPSCAACGTCREEHSCGRPYRDTDDLLADQELVSAKP